MNFRSRRSAYCGHWEKYRKGGSSWAAALSLRKRKSKGALAKAMSIFYRGETEELDDDARQSAGGSFVRLTDGITHYELSNLEQKNTVVLVHGFSVPYFIFDPTFEFLTKSGFRVLRYDLFGRGFSDRPRLDYNLDIFVRQLTDLLDALRITPPIDLVGLSMGGPVTAAFTTRFPGRVRSLTLIDPAGARAIEITPLIKVLKLPIVGDAILGLVGGETFVKSNARDFFDPRLVEHFSAQYRVQLQYKGFLRAILSSIRNGMLDSFIHVYRALGKMDKKVLLFWGRNDETVPFEHSVDLCAALPNAKLHVIEQCGHIPHYEKPDEVNPILLEFLQ